MGSKLDLPPPPTLTQIDGGDGGSAWVELLTARNDIDAQLLRGRLLESGIETKAIKDRSVPGAWLYGGSNPWAPVVVWVRRFQLDEARLALAELSYEGPPADEARWAVNASPSRRFTVMWWVTAIVLGLLLTGVALMKTAGSIEQRCDLPLLCAEPAPVNP